MMLPPVFDVLLTQDAIILSAIGLLAFCVRAYLRYRRLVALTPPGPEPIPLLGNILDIPSEQDWLTYAQWAKKYDSDLISVRAFGQLTIIINSAKAAKELLVERSSNSSDKPRLAMLELMDWDWALPFKRYNDGWRSRRRFLHGALNVTSVETYYPIEMNHARKLIASLYYEQQPFAQQVLHMTAGLSLYVAYALEDEKYANVAKDAMGLLSMFIFPGSTLVNVFPILKYLPEWFPGTGYHAYARRSRELNHKMRYDSLAKVKEQMANGTARPSLALSLLRSNGDQAVEELIADTTATIFVAGSDTSASAIIGAIRAFTLHPTVVKRAQAELDAVVGRDRLPDHADRSLLPYVDAVCREVLRWHTVTPLGNPHKTDKDDTYDGWLIPAGTTITWNAWAISHNPETYPDPDKFMPERFLDENGQLNGEEENTSFGYGRRVCVGLHFAKSTLWINVASLLSTYQFSKAKDKDGKEIDIPMGQTAGLVSHPVPFDCVIQPRDEKAIELIKSISLSLEDD